MNHDSRCQPARDEVFWILNGVDVNGLPEDCCDGAREPQAGGPMREEEGWAVLRASHHGIWWVPQVTRSSLVNRSRSPRQLDLHGP